MLTLDSRRIGRFLVRREALDDGLGLMIFADLIPVEVRHRFDADGLEVTAFGECFEEVPEGGIAPEYEICYESEASIDGQGFRIVRPVSRKFVRISP